MDPLLGGLITGGASLLGSIFGANTSASNTQAQIAASQQQQATQNAFTERMSNTAYERASADMKKAGLNPAMMFGSGGAASTPGGSSIQAPMPQNKSPFADLGENVGKAVSTAVSMKTMEEMASRIAKLDADKLQAEAQTVTEKARPALVAAETGATSAREALTSQEARTEKVRTDLAAQNLTKERLDRARQEWEAIKYIDLSHVEDNTRRAANIAGWGGEKVGQIISPIVAGVGSASGAARTFNDIWRSRATTHRDTKFYKGGVASEEWRQ